MKGLWRRLACLLVLQAIWAGASLADDNSPGLQNDGGAGFAQRHTLKALRDRNVVKQQTDYSCAAAALATLLTYYFGDTTSEYELLKLLEAKLSAEEEKTKKARGFSLADLKHVAELKGYKAAGFKLTFEQLSKLAAPVIVFVQPMGYNHFAVLRGIEGGRVFLADPARGNLRMSIGRFLGEWSGIVFVLGKAGEENIKAYPLTIAEREYWQPELFRIGAMSELGRLPRGVRVP